jgi:hypothetical protein
MEIQPPLSTSELNVEAPQPQDCLEDSSEEEELIKDGNTW